MSESHPRGSLQPSASYSFTMRVHHPQRPGTFGDIATAIGVSGAILGAIDLVRVEDGSLIRDLTVACVDSDHAGRVVTAVRGLPDIVVHSVSDRTFLLHVGGKIEVRSRVPVKTRDDLSMAYTPGVGARLPGDPREPRERVGADHQAQHGRGRVGRHRGARARRHRPRRGDAGHGGQGAALQGVRGSRRVPAVPGHQGRRRDRPHRQGRRAGLRRHQPRGHLCAALLRDRAAPARRAATSRSSTTTSTGRRSSCSPRSSTPCASSASRPEP